MMMLNKEHGEWYTTILVKPAPKHGPDFEIRYTEENFKRFQYHMKNDPKFKEKWNTKFGKKATWSRIVSRY
jgi:hypothetical protein